MTKHKIRGFIGVKSNDGHDAPILVVADILKKGGIETILGGYDLTVDKFVRAIIHEGVHFAGISSYNGGHLPFFKAVRDELRKHNYPYIHLIGGGGATITAPEIEILEREDGIDKIFKSGEGNLIVPYIKDHYDFSVVPDSPEDLLEDVRKGDDLAISQWLNLAEEKARLESMLAETANPVDSKADKVIRDQIDRYARCLAELNKSPAHTTAYGITGRGGAGKSTLLDELILRFFNDERNSRRKLAIIAIDPSSHASGGALLADRIAYLYAADKNWVDTGRIFIRSVAARGFGRGIARALPDMIKILRAAGYDIFVESYGIGQPDTGIVEFVDKTVFVATPDIGGAAQIAKEEMLNVPGAYVALNKNELRGARHVASLLRGKVERLFFTTAIEHKNPGVDELYQSLIRQ